MSLENISPEQMRELAELSKSLSENPQTRSQFLRLTKQVRPDVVIPEIELQEAQSKAFEDQNAKIQGLEAKLAEKELIENYNKSRQALIKKGLVENEDQIAEVEKVMVDKRIGDHEAAAEYWRYMKQAAEPTASSFAGQPVMSKFDLKNYFKNPVSAARSAAAEALTELRKNPKVVGF